MPTRFFFINQCQIITFLILKSDIIENSRIELKGIVLPVPSNQIKVYIIAKIFTKKKRVKVRSIACHCATKKRPVKITMYLGLDIIIQQILIDVQY